VSPSQSTDRESDGSHGSGGGLDSGISEGDSEKPVNGDEPKLTYGDPLSRRFLPGSYLWPDNPAHPLPLDNLTVQSPSSNDMYDTPPPARPVESEAPPARSPGFNSPASSPPIPGYEVMTSSPSVPQKPTPIKPRGIACAVAPPPPQKPSHMKYNPDSANSSKNEKEESAPPPPPRSYVS
jgi:hypothetical protein